MNYRPIVDYNPARGMIIVSLEDGSHAVFTLRSHAVIKVGIGVQGPVSARGLQSLIPDTRQLFDAFGETGPTTLEACQRMLWADA
ncbi:MAG: hypothetical protein EOP35_02615 [Rubrivivax sp.]|nr:MAG: hypothetical protein EOP35_02615 [Rubrivivax sp.]